MLFEVCKHALYLAVMAQIGYANAQTGPVPVVGISTGIDQTTGKVPSRMNINTLAQERGPMWDLLIRGLDALQNKPEDDERSHFAVAGIHGMPYAPYNGVGPVSGGSGGGYCPHQSPQLIPWHRAYLALYEQLLSDEVRRLALEYTDDDASIYRDASEKLRLPYWDWASDPALPPSASNENVTINGPDGEIELHNPLYSYRWQTYPLNETQFPGQGGIGPTTTRDIDENLQNANNLIRDSVYRTFASTTTWDQMASMAGSGSSFEAPHNIIHNLVGGSFVSLDLTSFDALFLLHHCNLDRLAAMWTASHNETMQTQPFLSQGLYSTAQGENVTAESSLKPFYGADGKSFHTGRTVAATEAFGYTYPDIPGPDQGRTKDVIAQINQLYGDIAAAKKSAAVPNARREWFIDIHVDRADLPLPCSINVYLKDQLAGRTLLLEMPKTGIAHDELSLSRVINRLDADNNRSEYIERALKNDLHVKVMKGDTTLDARNIPSLGIKVVGEDVTPPGSESEFPLYSNRTTLMTINVATMRKHRW
ncbi:Di-copper centre-containing protein [Xylaria bambusicola]|uniref:Di-copper centre-containing protein n=1 Tax=Xylaria bambusicola TaxID=326684 RepID=UPI002008A753|nr:Di-copper centre-containing protein [Xylaria bambusicola]KAI0505522.1 Di-copper centre-containing protein [Xylaria bambusicola]